MDEWRKMQWSKRKRVTCPICRLEIQPSDPHQPFGPGPSRYVPLVGIIGDTSPHGHGQRYRYHDMQPLPNPSGQHREPLAIPAGDTERNVQGQSTASIGQGSTSGRSRSQRSFSFTLGSMSGGNNANQATLVHGGGNRPADHQQDSRQQQPERYVQRLPSGAIALLSGRSGRVISTFGPIGRPDPQHEHEQQNQYVQSPSGSATTVIGGRIVSGTGVQMANFVNDAMQRRHHATHTTHINMPTGNRSLQQTTIIRKHYNLFDKLERFSTKSC